MSHRQMSVRDRVRGVLVLLLAAGLALPLLVAAGGSSTSVDAVIALARAQVGDRYEWGATGPDSWDCSGLTSYVWREAGGVVLPRVSGDQQKFALAIPREQLLPGDLAFFGDPVTHVALYVGDGRVVDASSARTGVLERPLWTTKDARYGRVPRADMPPVQPWTAPSPSASPAASPDASASASASASAAPTPSSGPTVSPTGTAAPQGRPASKPATTPTPSAGPTARPTATSAAGATTARPTRSPAAGARPATTSTPAAARPAATPVPARPAPATSASSRPASQAPAARPAPAASRPTGPATAAPAAPRPAAAVRALASLPAVQARPSSAVALKAVVAARAVVGATSGTDVSLVHAVWLRAGGPRLPTDRSALVARARQVPRPDVRTGDLVSYGTPARQVYLYAGKGYMVGWSAEHGAVVVRRVHTGDVRFLRLPG